MYVCEICNKQQGPGTPCKTVVIETKEYQHPFRSGEPPWAPKGMPKKSSPVGEHWEWDENKKKWKWTWYNDRGGVGRQIVREVNYPDPKGSGLGIPTLSNF